MVLVYLLRVVLSLVWCVVEVLGCLMSSVVFFVICWFSIFCWFMVFIRVVLFFML